MEIFNRVWTSPETLPTKEEITSPRLWLERVAGSSLGTRQLENPAQNGIANRAAASDGAAPSGQSADTSAADTPAADTPAAEGPPADGPGRSAG